MSDQKESVHNQNVAALMQQRALETPDRLAFIYWRNGRQHSVCFRNLLRRIDSCSAGLKKLGVSHGDRVVVMVPMSVELYTILLGILKLGAVSVFVDPWLKAGTIASIAAWTSPKAFAGTPKSHLLRLFNKKLWSIDVAISTKRLFGLIPPAHSLDSLLRSEGDEGIRFAKAEDPALITFTSGSSGIPKGANRTHGFLRAQHAALNSVIPYKSSDVDLSSFPVFALNNLATGITTVIPDIDFTRIAATSGERLFTQFEDAEVTTCTISPPLVDRLSDYIRSSELELPRLRRIVTGGAPVSDRQLREWKTSFPGTEIVIAYGSTEAEPVSHLSADERLTISSVGKGYCMGKPIHAVAAKIVKITDGPIRLGTEGFKEWELQQGQIGELIVTGDHVCQDYFNNPSATSENKIREQEGRSWHRMGDTGYLDLDGNFWLVGRTHSTIRRDEFLWHPQLIEQIVLHRIDYSGQVAVVAVPRRGELDLIFVVTTAAIDESDIAEALASSGYHADRIVTKYQDMPVDPRHNSKIDYKKLSERLLRDGVRMSDAS